MAKLMGQIDEAIDWFEFRGQKYCRPEASGGIVRSKVFPGLWLDSSALLSGDSQTLIETLNQGTASIENASFKKNCAIE